MRNATLVIAGRALPTIAPYIETDSKISPKYELELTELLPTKVFPK